MSLSTPFNGDCSDQIVFYFHMQMVWNASAIGRTPLEAMAYDAEMAFASSKAIFNVEKMSRRNWACKAASYYPHRFRA